MITKCEECQGKGKYEIRNAYNKDFRKIITCEYCGGLGMMIDNRRVK